MGAFGDELASRLKCAWQQSNNCWEWGVDCVCIVECAGTLLQIIHEVSFFITCVDCSYHNVCVYLTHVFSSFMFGGGGGGGAALGRISENVVSTTTKKGK